jgi:VanZ family protein
MYMYEQDGYITDQEPKPRRRISVAWLALIVVAWVLYELTHQPALAVIALCTKFGWEDFRTARWLRKRDPRLARGLASFFLYFACGLWKMAITATLMIFAYFILAIILTFAGGQGLNWRGVAPQLGGAVLVTLGGIVFSTLAVWLAILIALIAGCKLWLHASVHSARRHDHWPPPDPATPRLNLLDILVWTTLFAVGGPALLISIAFLVALLAGPFKQGAGALAFLICLGTSLVAAGLGARWLVRSIVDRRVLAKCPSECWGKSGVLISAKPLPSEMVEAT